MPLIWHDVEKFRVRFLLPIVALKLNRRLAIELKIYFT